MPDLSEARCDTCGSVSCYCDDPDVSDGGSCYDCGGRGWNVTCIDDLCHGQDYCIHGDPPTPCRNCNAEGEREDNY